MTTLWATIIVIGVLIFVHEMGHYLAARLTGVRVERFSIGFPPRLISFTSVPEGWIMRLFFYNRNSSGHLEWGPVSEKFIQRPGRKGSDTEYCAALLPLGGYVKMAGIIDESLDTDIQHQPYELLSKPAWAQIFVMCAGVMMNVLLAYALFTGVAFKMGKPVASPEPVIAQLVEGMPAQEVGLQIGDRILSINGQSVSTWEEMSGLIHTIPNSPITITWERNGSISEKSFSTAYQVAIIEGRIDTLGAIGIYSSVEYLPIGYLEALRTGLISTVRSFDLIFTSIHMLVTGAASIKDLGGPIMVAQLAGETAREGWIPLLAFMALISINLAFLNILPIPGLDGGHILIIVIQAIIRRPLTIKARVVIQQIGMAFLLLLMITIIVNDIGRLFTN